MMTSQARYDMGLSTGQRRMSLLLACAGVLVAVSAIGQPPPGPAAPIALRERIRVINMIPNSLSGETGQDGEPNLAVDPADPDRIVGTAFTDNPSGSNTSAPIFVSDDRGITWSLNTIVPSGNGMTGDISVAFAQRGGRLYSGILRGGSGLRMLLLRSANPFGAAMMTTLVDRQGSGVDQPWTEAKTTNASGSDVDRVFYGNNDFNAPSGRTASMETSLNAGTAPAPAGLTTTRLEARNTAGQDMPAIRVSVHDDGTAYGIFYRWAAGSTPNASCDVVVVRDDSWPTGATRFQDLVDAGDSLVGVRVTTGRIVPAFPASLGANRLVASNLSIAVDPTDSSRVWIAWADRVGTTDYTLHVRRSTNRGVSWSADLLTVTDATNPALAVNSSGTVGFLYQQLTGTAPSQRWKTHFRRRGKTGTTWSDRILADTPDNNPAPTFQPYIGDYTDVVALGSVFYGIFSASNIPDNANFPQGVTYQRNANFTSHTLQAADGTPPVAASIDPFFFSVRGPYVVKICKLNPRLCVIPKLEREVLKWKCAVVPCRVLDPVPKNCTLKWDCPGCSPAGLCPPWYNITLEGIDPKAWDIGVYTSGGDYVRSFLRPIDRGVVLSFRPSPRAFKEKEIGDYVLSFESDKVTLNQEFTVKARLDVSDKPPRPNP
jgi:hypothetical protein